MTDIIPPLTIEDHWCCHTKCPYIGTGKSCLECREEKLGLKSGKTSFSDGKTSKEETE